MKRRELTEENMQAMLEKYQAVIYSALKKLGIYHSHQRFDDYYQDGCLELFEAYQTCEEDPLAEKNTYTFVNFLQRRLRWAYLDLLRKESYIQELESIPDEALLQQTMGKDSFEDQVEMEDLLHCLAALLSEKELSFLKDRLFLELSLTEIAHKHGVSRKTVHHWRRRIQEKAAFLLPK